MVHITYVRATHVRLSLDVTWAGTRAERREIPEWRRSGGLNIIRRSENTRTNCVIPLLIPRLKTCLVVLKHCPLPAIIRFRVRRIRRCAYQFLLSPPPPMPLPLPLAVQTWRARVSALVPASATNGPRPQQWLRCNARACMCLLRARNNERGALTIMHIQLCCKRRRVRRRCVSITIVLSRKFEFLEGFLPSRLWSLQHDRESLEIDRDRRIQIFHVREQVHTHITRRSETKVWLILFYSVSLDFKVWYYFVHVRVICFRNKRVAKFSDAFLGRCSFVS